MPATANGPTPALPDNSSYQLGDGNLNEQLFYTQGPATALTTTTNLTAAQLSTGILDYVGAGHSMTLPLATAMDTAFPNARVNSMMRFSVIAVGGTCTLVTNTGWTIDGALTTADATANMYGARKTGTATWTLYRLS